jgi:superfamily II DNA/RNA helicase
LLGRGVDFERVNIVINYDMPGDAETYLHHVGRTGRFDTKGLAISFVAGPDDVEVFESVKKKFEVPFAGLPETLDSASYSMYFTELGTNYFSVIRVKINKLDSNLLFVQDLVGAVKFEHVHL